MFMIRRAFAATLISVSLGCASSPRSGPAPETATPAVQAAPAVPPEQKVTVAIIVRHAEKVDNSSDPDLSAAGMERARALVESVRRAKVSAIITTQFKRTRATAEPSATALGITPEVMNASSPTHAMDVANAVRARDGVTLVVGHSNTVPAIIAALGGRAPVICDSEYDNLYVVTLPADGGAPIMVHTHYGVTSERGAGCPQMK